MVLHYAVARCQEANCFEILGLHYSVKPCTVAQVHICIKKKGFWLRYSGSTFLHQNKRKLQNKHKYTLTDSLSLSLPHTPKHKNLPSLLNFSNSNHFPTSKPPLSPHIFTHLTTIATALPLF